MEISMNPWEEPRKNQPMHTLIVGEQGVGKSTLIHRVMDELQLTVCGFETRKEDELVDPLLGSPLYIYEAGLPHIQREDNLVGHCKDQKPVVYPEGFDRFAERLEQLSNGASESDAMTDAARHADADVILMDEIGVMESRSERFCQAILHLLDGDMPVLAAVKYKDRPFLQQVRSHPRCRCFQITPENREELYHEVLAFVKEQRM